MKKYKYESYDYSFEKKYYIKISSLDHLRDYIIRSATYNEETNTIDLILYNGLENITMTLDSSNFIEGNYG